MSGDEAPDDDLEVVAFGGILGWSNKRTGVEFYHSGEDGRWGIRPNGYEQKSDPGPHWGYLLTDEIEHALRYAEGRPVVVLVGVRGDTTFLERVRARFDRGARR